MTSTGSAAPPDTQRRRQETSNRSRSGWLSRAWYIVGTPSKIVTWSRWMISSALPASKRGIMVRQAPTFIAALSPQVWPKEWNSGRAPSRTSRSVPSNSVRTDTSQFLYRLSCVSSAPFGVPVVPDV